MAATFPNAKKTFSQIVNGVTKLVASLFNVDYDETEAIETFIGATGGGAQSYSTSLTDMLINFRRGCRVDYKSAADLYVRAGEIMIIDASGNRRLRRNTADTTVAWTDIDTGAEANSTVYYVYACADNNATTFTVKISINATTPTGMTFYKKIGAFYNNASGNIIGITNLNLTGGIIGTYDSGWFAVALDGEYSFTHSLGTMKCLRSVYFSDASDGSGVVLPEQQAIIATGVQCAITDLSATTVDLKAGHNYIAQYNIGAATTTYTAGYARIILTALE